MRHLEKLARKETTEESKHKKIFERGYSETEQAKDIEFRSGDLQALKTNKSFQQLKGSAKVLVAYQTVSRQLSDLVGSYLRLMEKDLHQAQKMHYEIGKIQRMQKLLLTRIFGKLPEENGEKEMLKELEDFL